MPTCSWLPTPSASSSTGGRTFPWACLRGTLTRQRPVLAARAERKVFIPEVETAEDRRAGQGLPSVPPLRQGAAKGPLPPVSKRTVLAGAAAVALGLGGVSLLQGGEGEPRPQPGGAPWVEDGGGYITRALPPGASHALEDTPEGNFTLVTPYNEYLVMPQGGDRARLRLVNLQGLVFGLRLDAPLDWRGDRQVLRGQLDAAFSDPQWVYGLEGAGVVEGITREGRVSVIP